MAIRVEVIELAEGWECTVTVVEETETKHTVTVLKPYYEELTGSKVPVEQLVEASFAFLLEREPKESILSSFNLNVIQTYFPSYETTIRKAWE